jgi:hypothetical protein
MGVGTTSTIIGQADPVEGNGPNSGNGATHTNRLSMVMEVRESEAGALAAQAAAMRQLEQADLANKLPKKNKLVKLLKTVAVGTVMVVASTVALLIPIPDMSQSSSAPSAEL